MTKLARTLGFRDLLFIVIGSVIGSGIFRSPGAVLGQVDTAIAPALMVWLVGGVLSLLGALTYIYAMPSGVSPPFCSAGLFSQSLPVALSLRLRLSSQNIWDR
jgi:amino acid transporter